MEQAYSIIHSHLSFPYWISLIVVFVIVFAVWKVIAKKKWAQSALIAVFCTYIFFILLITLIARTPADTPKIKLIPFWSWYEVIVNHNRSLAVEIILNVMLFLPVGILVQLLNIALRRVDNRRVDNKRRGDRDRTDWISVPRVAVFCAIFSLSIELTQYFTCRGLAEVVDDVVSNTLGGAVGCWCCGCIIKKIRVFKKIRVEKA